jgi:serine/threonine protein kinase
MEQLLANRYQIQQLIGRGGMGEVFLAADILLGNAPVAIKFLSQTISEQEARDDFIREALLSAALSQKSIHIVRAYDYGLTPTGKPFYVMEYLSGKSLKDLIPTPLPLFLNLVRQICLGLQCAHTGVSIDRKIYPLVHRDIKPANIMVIPDETLGQIVKILDFGVAHFSNDSAFATHTKVIGTLPYCSPEQLEDDELDSRSDIYSLGVMMFEMLTGQKPWQPESDLFGAWYKAHQFEPPRAILEVSPQLKIPQQLNDLIMTCLAKQPSHRPQAVEEIIQVLNQVEEFLPKVSVSPSLESIQNPTTLNSSFLDEMTKVCWQMAWPADKPIREIVFPRFMNTEVGKFTALCLMLSRQDINQRMKAARGNKFIFLTSPHPMVLWVTFLYNRELEPKWLPCYLDMQNPQNIELLLALSECDRYPLIFFTLESPHSCANVLNSNISLQQRQLLKTWIEESRKLPITSQATVSKSILRDKYKEMQSIILQNLENLKHV